MTPITRGLQGPGNLAGFGQAPADTVLSGARAIHCPHGGGGLGIHLSSLNLGSNYCSWAGHCQDHPMDGNTGLGRTGLGLLLGGFPSHNYGLGEGVGGTNSDFQQSMVEAMRLKDRVSRDRG